MAQQACSCDYQQMSTDDPSTEKYNYFHISFRLLEPPWTKMACTVQEHVKHMLPLA